MSTDDSSRNIPRQEIPGQLANDPSDEDNDAPDTGGYFEFVNPRALQSVNEDGGDDDECYNATSATAQLESGTACPAESIACLSSFVSITAAMGDAPCGTFNETLDNDADEDFGDFAGLSAAEVEAVVQGSLRQLQREYAEVSGHAAAADEPLPVPTGLGTEKAAKLLQLRAALAAARAARTTASSAVYHPEMELSPGADEFPEDYDALQALDSTAVDVALDSFVQIQSAPPPPPASTVSASDGHGAPSAAEPDFDPFGTGNAWLTGQRPLSEKAKHKVFTSTAAPASAAAAGAKMRRPVSPLAPEVKTEIRSVMAKIKITPRGGASLWTERAVQAALLQAENVRKQALSQASVVPDAAAPLSWSIHD